MLFPVFTQLRHHDRIPAITKKSLASRLHTYMKKLSSLFALILLTALPIAAQQLVSLEIHPDRTVTFQVRAPNATNVSVSLEAGATKPMERNARRSVERHHWPAIAEPIRL